MVNRFRSDFGVISRESTGFDAEIMVSGRSDVYFNC